MCLHAIDFNFGLSLSIFMYPHAWFDYPEHRSVKLRDDLRYQCFSIVLEIAETVHVSKFVAVASKVPVRRRVMFDEIISDMIFITPENELRKVRVLHFFHAPLAHVCMTDLSQRPVRKSSTSSVPTTYPRQITHPLPTRQVVCWVPGVPSSNVVVCAIVGSPR